MMRTKDIMTEIFEYQKSLLNMKVIKTENWVEGVVDFQKNLFDNSFTIMCNAMEHGETALRTVTERNLMLPNNAVNVVEYWSGFHKNARTNYKKYVDISFDRVKQVFNLVEPASPVPVTPFVEAQSAKK